MFGVALKLSTDVVRLGRKLNERRLKALRFALQRSTYNLWKAARDDVKRGRLGLQRLSYLTDRSDPRFKERRARKNARLWQTTARAPMTSLFKGIQYKVNKRALSSQVGFLGGGYAWAADIVDKSVKGYRWHYSERQKEILHRMGIHLRQSTSAGRVPARDMMGAVREKHEAPTFQQMRSLFLRKLRGERIA